jgi:hypothetical protein
METATQIFELMICCLLESYNSDVQFIVTNKADTHII